MKPRSSSFDEWAIVILLAILLALLVVLIVHSKPPKHTSNLSSTSTTETVPPVIDPMPAPSRALIPGGVHSIEELRQRVAKDLVLFNAYFNFDWSTARETTLPRDAYVYMSYRLGNHIFYTKHAVLLRAGTPIIIDALGHAISMVCGNVFSLLPAYPTEPEPMPDMVFSPIAPPLFDTPPNFTPTFETTDIATPDLVLPPAESIPPSTTDYPVSGLPPIYGGAPCCFLATSAPVISPTLPSPTPEPTPIITVVTGLAIIAVLYRNRKTR